MAMEADGHSPKRWLDALFPEARELERRRRRRYVVVAALCVLAAAVTGAARRDEGGGSAGAVGQSSTVRFSSVALHLGVRYPQLAAIGNRIIVSGGAQGYRLVAGRVAGTCESSTIDPLTLRLISTAHGNCGTPALYGRRVLPISYLADRRGPTGSTLGLRIAIADSAARYGYHLGPELFTYTQCSDCQIGWIYGAGSLWVYSPLGRDLRERHGELFRISDTTGRVLQRWAMPVFLRPLLAVDADGLWLSQSLYSGLPGHIPPAERVDYQSIYRVAPGMATPERAVRLGNLGAYWMVASRHSVWVDESNLGRPSRLWRFDGADARSLIHGRPLPSGAGCGQLGAGQPTVAGSAAAGIYCLDGFRGGVRGFNATTGDGRRYRAPWFMAGPAVNLGSSVYLLGVTGSGDASRLFRVGGS